MKNLEFKHVSFSYGEKKVWEDLNLCFEAGKKSIVMGPSGIGKTTLFRLALGLILPDQGQILGIPGDGAGVLFQEDRLFPHLSVLENLKVCVPETNRGRTFENAF